MRLVILLGGVALMCACQGQAGEKSEPKGEDPGVTAPVAAAAAAEQKLYTVSAVPNALDTASENSILVQFKPVAGYHWNVEYPTSFKVTTQEGLATDKPAYSAAEETVTATEAGADIPMKVKVHKGISDLQLTGNFSLCQDDSCKLFRNEKVVVPLSTK